MKPFAGAAIATLVLSACATTADVPPGEIADPYEGFNRKMFAFNTGVDKYALGPASDVYKAVTPEFARDRVHDFFSNLKGPVVFANDVLQAEPNRAGNTAARFTINSTVGLLGLWDAADHFGIEGHSEDFGQTLAVWGIESGPYLVMPLIGPTTPRDLFGMGVDAAITPTNYIQYDNDKDSDVAIRVGMGVVSALNARVALDDQIESLNAQLSPYVALRSVYSSQRQAEIANGKVDENTIYDDLPDFDEFEE